MNGSSTTEICLVSQLLEDHFQFADIKYYVTFRANTSVWKRSNSQCNFRAGVSLNIHSFKQLRLQTHQTDTQCYPKQEHAFICRNVLTVVNKLELLETKSVVINAGATHSSAVELSLMVQWVAGSIPCGPIELFLIPASTSRLV